MLLRAFPDARFEPQKILVADDHAVVLARLHGTHQGSFMGIEPTGRTIDVPIADVIRVADDGRVAEHWGYTDRLALLVQLGATPDRIAATARQG